MSIKMSELLSEVSSQNAASVSAELLDMLQENPSTKGILDYAYRKIGNPVMLVDVTYYHVASSGIEDVRDEPVWEYTIRNGLLPDRYMNYMNKIVNADLEEMDVVDQTPGKFFRHRQLISNLYRNGQLVGFLLLLQTNKEISNEDRVMLQLISGIISIRMKRKVKNDRFASSIVESFLASIIRNRITNREEIESRQELLDIKLKEVLRVISIQMTGIHISEYQKVNVYKQVNKLFDKYNVIQFNSYIIVLYDVGEEEDSFPSELWDELALLLENNSCEANVSFPFRRLSDFYNHYVQTVYCVKARQRLNLRCSIVLYDEVITDHMLTYFSDLIDLDYMLNDSVREIMKVDDDNNSDYLNTMFAYVNCQQNLSRAAERMQLHYNTLKYRINRIIEMTGVDFNDEETVFSIMMSERILDIKRKTGQTRNSR